MSLAPYCNQHSTFIETSLFKSLNFFRNIYIKQNDLWHIASCLLLKTNMNKKDLWRIASCLLFTFFFFFFLKKVKRCFYLLLLYYSRKPPLKLQINGTSLFNYSRDPKIMDFFRRYYPYLVSNPLCWANLLRRQLTLFFFPVSVNSGRT